MVYNRKVRLDRVPLILLALSFLCLLLDAITTALIWYLDIRSGTTWVYYLAIVDLPFAAVVLAWMATASGGVLRWRYDVQNIRPWVLVLCAWYSIGVTILFAYFILIFFVGGI